MLRRTEDIAADMDSLGAPEMAQLARDEGAGKNRLVKASSPPSNNGWTTSQLALVLMLFGIIADLCAIKCLVFGPSPYSVSAYVIGPCLIVAGYFVDPSAIRNLLIDGSSRQNRPLPKAAR